jgi:hypothetical protein
MANENVIEVTCHSSVCSFGWLVVGCWLVVDKPNWKQGICSKLQLFVLLLVFWSLVSRTSIILCTSIIFFLVGSADGIKPPCSCGW